MMGRSAVVVGSAAWIAACATLGQPGLVLAAGLPVVAALSVAPDVDSPNSHAAQALGPLRKPLAPVIEKVFGGHRQGTHSLPVAGIVIFGFSVLGAYLGAPWLALAAVCGYLVGGIWTDVVTRAGVGLLWPFSERQFRIARLRTGAWYEYPIALSLLALAAWYAWPHYSLEFAA